MHVLVDLFDRMDHDNDGYIHKPEVEQFVQRSEGSAALATSSVTVRWLLKKLGKRKG